MTEVTFNRKTFISTLDAFKTRFELASSIAVLETEPSGERFILSAKRTNGIDVRAFGPCSVKGEPLNVEFDLSDLEKAITDATATSDNLTLLIGDGLWVKEALPAEEGGE
jgi:hypothetical protein